MKTSSIETIARELQRRGLLLIVSSAVPECLIVEPLVDWRRIACEGSTLAGGKWLSPGNGVYQNLPHGGGWLIPESAWDDVQQSREVALSLTGETGGYSVASNARRCWNWAIPVSRETPNARALQGDTGIGYSHVVPGEFPDCWQVDMSGCYWRLLQRLPTRKWEELRPGIFRKNQETKEERARLRAVFSALEPYKKMMNSVWGSCLGRTDTGFYFYRGEMQEQKPYYGSHPTAALIVGRMAWELTLLASHHCEAVYAQTDGIICHKNKEPRVWEQYGIPYRVQRWGDATIHRQHVYKVGQDATKLFHPLDTFREAKPMGAMPTELYLTKFI